MEGPFLKRKHLVAVIPGALGKDPQAAKQVASIKNVSEKTFRGGSRDSKNLLFEREEETNTFWGHLFAKSKFYTRGSNNNLLINGE